MKVITVLIFLPIKIFTDEANIVTSINLTHSFPTNHIKKSVFFHNQNHVPLS